MNYSNKPVKSATKPTLVQQPQGGTQMVMATKTEPLHSPEMLEKYNEIHPDFAERVLRMAEKEQAERHKQSQQKHELEVKNQNSLYRSIMRGQIFGLIAAFGAMGLCGYFAYLGDVKNASYASIGVVASLTAVFITGRLVTQKSLPKE